MSKHSKKELDLSKIVVANKQNPKTGNVEPMVLHSSYARAIGTRPSHLARTIKRQLSTAQQEGILSLREQSYTGSECDAHWIPRKNFFFMHAYCKKMYRRDGRTDAMFDSLEQYVLRKMDALAKKAPDAEDTGDILSSDIVSAIFDVEEQEARMREIAEEQARRIVREEIGKLLANARLTMPAQIVSVSASKSLVEDTEAGSEKQIE